MSAPPKLVSSKHVSSLSQCWRNDAGATVVEMLVTTFLLSLGVMGVVMLLATSSRTASIADVQADATVLASSELEIVRSLDYDVVGISTSASGYVPTFAGRPTVTESTNLIEPSTLVVVGDVTFSVERSVTWATVGADTQAYKIVNVVVAWESASGPTSIDAQTGLHEGLVRG